MNEHIVSLTPLELTWLHPDTDNNTASNQSALSLRFRHGNEGPIIWLFGSWPVRPISCVCWAVGWSEQPISALSERLLDQWAPPSGCAEGVSVCGGPISGSVLPAGAGDWCLGAAAASASGPDGEPGDGTQQGERRPRWVRGYGRGLRTAGAVSEWQRGEEAPWPSRADGWLAVYRGVLLLRCCCWETIERLCFAIYWCRLTCWPPAAVASNCSFAFKGPKLPSKDLRDTQKTFPPSVVFW